MAFHNNTLQKERIYHSFPLRAIVSVWPNFSVYFTLRTYFFYFHYHFSKTLTSIHLFYNLFYLNKNIFFKIFDYYSFVPISLSFLCTYLFILSLSLSLSDQSFVPPSLLLPFMATSSSSFHVSNHPPLTSSFFFFFFFFFFLSQSDQLSTTSTIRIKTHKH